MATDLIGGLAALGSALLFTIAAALFQKVAASVPAAGINLYKGAVAIVLLSAFLCLRGLQPLDSGAFVMLGLSGLLGITVGDTAYFLALSHLGARRTMLLDSVGPGMTAVMAVLVLHEALSPQKVAGLLLTVGGVAAVMRERGPQAADEAETSWRGWLYGLLSVACHASGVILSKLGLLTASSVDGTLIRIMWATTALALIGSVRGSLGTWLSPLRDRTVLAMATLAAIVGSTFGIWLSQAALAFTSASLAATLNATGPVFVLVIARVYLHERVTPRAVAAAAAAVCGASLLLLA